MLKRESRWICKGVGIFPSYITPLAVVLYQKRELYSNQLSVTLLQHKIVEVMMGSLSKYNNVCLT